MSHRLCLSDFDYNLEDVELANLFRFFHHTQYFDLIVLQWLMRLI